MPSSHEIVRGGERAAARRGPTTAAPRRGRAAGPSIRIHRRKSGSEATTARLHRVERRPADAVGEQRRVEWRLPLAAAVDDVGLALDRVHRRRDRRGDRRPRRHLGVVGGLADERRRSSWRVRGRPASAAVSTCPSGNRTVGGELRRDVALQPRTTPTSRWSTARRTDPPPPRSSGDRRARPGAAAGRGARARASLPSGELRRRRAPAPSRRGVRAAGGPASRARSAR